MQSANITTLKQSRPLWPEYERKISEVVLIVYPGPGTLEVDGLCGIGGGVAIRGVFGLH